MPNSYLDGLIEGMNQDPQMRQVFHMAYPRRIVPPGGYMNPKYYAPTTASSIYYALRVKEEQDFVKSCIFFISRKMVSLRVPTFFVGQEFAEAVSETRIESTMRSEEIVWPDEAMLFVLPEKFSRAFFGYNIPFLALANYSAEEVRGMSGIRVITREGGAAGPGAQEKLDGQVFMNFQWHQNNTEPGLDYISSWPLKFTMEHVAEQLGTGKLAVTDEENELIAKGQLDHVGMTDEAIEKQLMTRMRDFAAKLLMAMTAEPVFVERGVLQRKAKMKHNRLQEELWSPNTIGFKYRHPVAEGEGTHASPRLHRRSGHFRDQPYGPGRTKIRNMWIKPMWIGAKDKSNKGG